MATESTKSPEPAAPGAEQSGPAGQEVAVSGDAPTSPVSSRSGGGWPGFGELFEAFPSLFSHRWDLPSLFNQRWPGGTSGLDPMKVEELVDEGSYLIRAEIPGVDPEEAIDISVDNGRLTIKVEREQRTEANEANEFRTEFHYGSYRRSLTLPVEADVDNIKATYVDGILEVRIPLDEAASGRTKIAVERAGKA